MISKLTSDQILWPTYFLVILLNFDYQRVNYKFLAALQLDLLSIAAEQKINFPTNQEGYGQSETAAEIVPERLNFWGWTHFAPFSSKNYVF